jgi:succinate dehydrogenase / fumarate reductase iron-sulfur subunit
MKLTLKNRQATPKAEKIVEYPEMESKTYVFLEMLDSSKRRFNQQRDLPVSFDDCREGICGSCSLYINGEAHGPDRRVPTCQLHMRMFKDGDTILLNL